MKCENAAAEKLKQAASFPWHHSVTVDERSSYDFVQDLHRGATLLRFSVSLEELSANEGNNHIGDQAEQLSQ